MPAHKYWLSVTTDHGSLKANYSEFTLIFNCFQKLRLLGNRKPDIKIRFQYRENALNPSYIRNTSDWRLKYEVIGNFCFRVKQKIYQEVAELNVLT